MSTTAFDLLVLGDCSPDLILSGDQVEPKFGQALGSGPDGEPTLGRACGAPSTRALGGTAAQPPMAEAHSALGHHA